jgi:hypothetical protein
MWERMKSFHVVLFPRSNAGGTPRPPKDVPDRLIGDRMPQIGQRSHNAFGNPTGVAPRQPDHQILDLLSHPSPPSGGALLCPVELPGNQISGPGQDRIRFRHAGNLRQGFASYPFGDLGQCRLLAIRLQQASFDMCLQDAVLRHQVLIL